MPIPFAMPEADQKILFPYASALEHGPFKPILLTGKNANVGTTLVDIWGFNVNKTLPAVAYTLALVSDNANDTSAGTGAQTVAVNFLDSLYLPHTAVYALNGQTAVTVAASIDGGGGGTVSNCLRVNGMEVLTVGTGSANAGNLYACDSSNTYTAGVPQTASKVFEEILAGDNVDSSSSFTVPAGFRFMLNGILPAINDTTSVAKFGKVRFMQTTGANGIWVTYPLGGVTSNNNPDLLSLPIWPIAEEKTEIKFMANASAVTEFSLVAFGLLWAK